MKIHDDLERILDLILDFIWGFLVVIFSHPVGWVLLLGLIWGLMWWSCEVTI